MSDKRDSGKRKAAIEIPDKIDHLERWRLNSMEEALPSLNTYLWYFRHKSGDTYHTVKAIPARAHGDKERLEKSLLRSEELINEAIIYDPRLARRNRWKRSEDGAMADPGLIAAGDDAPCFCRVRQDISQNNAIGDPIRIVISTDANEVKPDTAAAFIATARLVQQFRPIEIWWQGAWLSEDKRRGFVFHVPLIQGDMDFSRIEFCVSDQNRDTLSFAVMIGRVVQIKQCHNGCMYRAKSTYLENTDHFIDHEGIRPNGETVANYAASWLKWDSVWDVKYEYGKAEKGALQMIPEPTKPVAWNETPQEKADREQRWRDYDREQKEREAQQAKERMAAV